MSRTQKWTQFGCAVLLLPLFAFVSFYLFWWLKIKYKPLPPIPSAQTRYSIKDAGDAGRLYIGGWYAEGVPGRLTQWGQLLLLDQQGVKADENAHKARRDALGRRLKLGPRSHVRVAESNGCAVLWPDSDAFEVRCQGSSSHPLHRALLDYKWKPICEVLPHGINRRGVAIGHARIATGCASSGGASEPHGRFLAIVSEQDAFRDLNSITPRASGWYLDLAVDINGAGQILCVGHQANAHGNPAAAEVLPLNFRWLILTPR